MSVPVVRQVVPLPPGVEVVAEACLWTRDAKALMCGFHMKGRGIQVATIRPDGSGFQCLTCGAGVTGEPWKLGTFPDGKRFFVGTLPSAEATASSGANVIPQIGECAPSILDCRRTTISKVSLPTIPGGLNDREARIAPDGKHFLWTVVRTDGFLLLMGDLERAADGYRVSGVRVLNAVPHPRSAADWAARMSLSEAKTFIDGSRILFQSTRGGGLNTDVYELDLRTGEVRRITHELEWDEDAQFDPTDRYLIAFSHRRMHNVRRAMALAAVPSFMDGALRTFIAPAELVPLSERVHGIQPWLTTREQERASRSGEMLNDHTRASGWGANPNHSPWSPDGTRAVWGERHHDGRSRLVVTTFPTLRRQPPACLNPEADPACQTPTPRWAPPIGDYPPLAPGAYSIPGPRGGSATLVYSTVVGGVNSVHFSRFTDADGRTYDGTMQQTGSRFFGLPGSFSQDIDISGSHTGHIAAQIKTQNNAVCGTVDTVLDGRHLHTNVGQANRRCGFPPPEICPDGANADATDTGDCSQDGLPSRWLAPTPHLRLTARATPRRDIRAPHRFRVTGRLRVRGTPARDICANGGSVHLEARAGSRIIATRRAGLRANCTYTLPVTLAHLRHRTRVATLTVHYRSVADLVVTARAIRVRGAR